MPALVKVYSVPLFKEHACLQSGRIRRRYFNEFHFIKIKVIENRLKASSFNPHVHLIYQLWAETLLSCGHHAQCAAAAYIPLLLWLSVKAANAAADSQLKDFFTLFSQYFSLLFLYFLVKESAFLFLSLLIIWECYVACCCLLTKLKANSNRKLYTLALHNKLINLYIINETS